MSILKTKIHFVNKILKEQKMKKYYEIMYIVKPIEEDAFKEAYY